MTNVMRTEFEYAQAGCITLSVKAWSCVFSADASPKRGTTIGWRIRNTR